MQNGLHLKSAILGRPWRRPVRAAGAGCCVVAAALFGAGCGSNTESLPSQYVTMTYSVTPPGATTGGTPMTLLVTSDATSCQRVSNKIVVSAALDAAGITFTLSGQAAQAQAALRADKDTATVAEVDLKLPLTFDSRTRETSNPVNFLTSDRNVALSCTLSIAGPDPFATFDGDYNCSAQPSATMRAIQAAGHFHALPCPPGF